MPAAQQLFLPHLLLLAIELKHLEFDPKLQILSSFLIEIESELYLVTAGHAIEDLNLAIEAGYLLSNCSLIDFVTNDGEATPFHFELGEFLYAYEEGGVDYATIKLSLLYSDMMRNIGVKSFRPADCLEPSSAAMLYVVYGAPLEWTEHIPAQGRQDFLKSCPTPITLDRMEDHIVDDNFRRMVFKVTAMPKSEHKGPLDSIVGMSGGPVFAFRQTDQGLKYWLVGLQSKWKRNQKELLVCPITFLITALVEINRVLSKPSLLA